MFFLEYGKKLLILTRKFQIKLILNEQNQQRKLREKQVLEKNQNWNRTLILQIPSFKQ